MRRVLTERPILRRKQTKYSWAVLIVGAAFYCLGFRLKKDEVVFWGACYENGNFAVLWGVAAN